MTQDQLMGLVRQALPMIGSSLVLLGVSATTAQAYVNLAMTISGPIIIVASAVWAFVANSRTSIMTAAAKPVAPGVPPPQIVLPKEEAPLAATLPANVTSK